MQWAGLASSAHLCEWAHDEQVHADDNLDESDPTLVWVAAALPAGLARVELYRGRQVLGDLDYRACPTCTLAVLEQIRVNPAHRRKGHGTVLARAVLAAFSDYEWSSTALAETATAFWDAIGWPGLRGDPRWCPHMHQADEQTR